MSDIKRQADLDLEAKGQDHQSPTGADEPSTLFVPAAATLPQTNQSRSFLTYRRKIQLSGLLFVLPVVVFFAIFSVYPMAQAFYVSFFRWDLLTPMEFVGLDNYTYLLSSENFLSAFKTTWYYVLLVFPASWTFGFILALLLNAKFRGRSIFRTIFFLPSVFPVIATALAWWVMFQAGGLVDNVVGQSLFWMTRTIWAMPGIAIMEIWRSMGYWMVMFLVGLQSIPESYYDAAKIDGAGSLQLTWHITLPLMKPIFALIFVISMIWGMQVFAPMMVMTHGGPGISTESLVMLIYETGILQSRMGRATAMSVILFLFILVLTIIQLQLFREKAVNET